MPQADSDKKKQAPIKTSIFYMNDIHGQNIRMERLVNAVNQFDSFTPEGTDKMKFAPGDIMLGEDEKQIKVANNFLNLAGIMATVMEIMNVICLQNNLLN